MTEPVPSGGEYTDGGPVIDDDADDADGRFGGIAEAGELPRRVPIGDIAETDGGGE